MIGLLIQDNAFEQDIRELLMSFYPGEIYAHEVKEGVEFYVESRLEAGEARLLIWDPAAEPSENAAGEPEGICPPVPGFALAMDRRSAAGLSDHLGTKNVIKQMFYRMLCERTGKTLPWGSLTGIRPTKIALSRLEEGWDEAEIRRYMKEMYLAGDEKIDLSVEIAAREKQLLEPLDYERGYSLYVGIHFCPTN